jgi:hypothetical protein
MLDITTKDLEDDTVQRFLHIYKADTALMLVLERKNIAAGKDSHHYFCFGSYKTDTQNVTTIEGVMVSRAVSG